MASERLQKESRAELLRHSAAITLDPNTANRRLGLSEENRKITLTEQRQSYSDHPDRFAGFCCQVLSRESLTGRCYWEVETRGGGVIIAVAEEDISRKGRLRECLFGLNNKSWALYCYEDSCEFRYNNVLAPVCGPRSSRLGVFLDHSAGILSFYSVSADVTLLHRVHTSFTQPLHAGFTLYYPGDSAEIVTDGSSSPTADKLQEHPRDTRTNVPERRTKEQLLLSEPEPKTRAELLRHSVAITLDPNTAHRRLGLPEDNRGVAVMEADQSYSDHPDRFLGYYQVLSREGLTGRCYWEVEWRGGVRVAVTYRSIRRDGRSEESSFGFNDKSWALYCNKDSYVFVYNRTSSPVCGPESSRLGVFLDHSAGVLSFYSVAPTLTLLHRVQTSFTQPLHAGIRLYYPGDSAEIVRDGLRSTAVSQTADRKKEIPRDAWADVPERRTKILLFQPEPKTRLELLGRSAVIALDPNTANRHLGLSEGNRKVTLMRGVLRYSDHPDRFAGSCQVLSREGLTGRCYWEVETRGRGGVDVAVAYKSISRNRWSGESSFGSNDQSWALECYKGSYVFMYNGTSFPVSGPESSRLGVFLDHSAGVLSFYSVAPTLTLLHRVQTSFTQPLHAGIRLYYPGDSAEIVRDGLRSPAVSQTADRKKEIPRDVPERRTKILLFQPEPKTRLELLGRSAAIALDPNTANRHLGLSEGNRKVTLMRGVLRYSDHPDRFAGSCQVLSREGLTGRCYWEVETRGRGGVDVAVAYKSISRNRWSGESSFGSNDQSWALECYKGSYVFMYNGTSFPVSGPESSRLGVFLDHSAGVLSFYSVSPTLTLLHRVQTSFTQPLHAGFTLHGSPGTSAEIVRV